MTRNLDAVAYAGELAVKNGDFYLYAERLILKDEVIEFAFTGKCIHGDFTADGIAKLASFGIYVSNHIKVIYRNFPSSLDHATIQFDVIRPTPKKVRCYIEGKWLEGGDAWPFSASINKFKPKLRAAKGMS
jgi:hypothetical protein